MSLAEHTQGFEEPSDLGLDLGSAICWFCDVSKSLAREAGTYHWLNGW